MIEIGGFSYNECTFTRVISEPIIRKTGLKIFGWGDDAPDFIVMFTNGGEEEAVIFESLEEAEDLIEQIEDCIMDSEGQPAGVSVEFSGPGEPAGVSVEFSGPGEPAGSMFSSRSLIDSEEEIVVASGETVQLKAQFEGDQ